MTPALRAFSKPSRDRLLLVLGEGESRDELQVNGRWIAIDDPIDLEGSR